MRPLACQLAAYLLLLSAWLLGNSEGSTCYNCRYTNRTENVTSPANYEDKDCVDKFGSSMNCNHYFPERKYCLKAYEDGFTSDGAYYQTVVRTCIADKFPTPCIRTNRSDPDPAVHRTLAVINSNGSQIMGYDTFTFCLCVGDLCNDERGFNTTQGSFEDNGNDVDGLGSKLSLSSLLLCISGLCSLLHFFA